MKTKYFLLLLILLITYINILYLSNNEELGTVGFGIGRYTLLFIGLVVLYLIKHSTYIINSPLIIRIVILLGVFPFIITTLKLNNLNLLTTLNTFSIIFYWVFAFLVAYVTTRKNKYLLSYTIKWFALSMLIISYYYFIVALFFNYYNNGNYLALNQSNYLLLLLPFILSINNNKLKIFGIIIISIAIFLSLKRTGTIALFGAIGFYYLIIYIQSIKIKNSVRFLTVFLLISIIALVLSFDYISSKTEGVLVNRLQSMQEDEGSGRFIIWENTIKAQMNSGIHEWLFGHGYNAVAITSNRNSAHNDFLEVLFDYGIVGFVFYLALYHQLYVYSKKMNKIRSPLLPPFIASIIIFIIVSSFSHLLIYPTYFIYLSFFWGSIIGSFENEYKMHFISNKKFVSNI